MMDVRITSIDVPFGEILWLTFKAFCASILVSLVISVIAISIITLLGFSMFG